MVSKRSKVQDPILPSENTDCPLCERKICFKSNHHLIPRCREKEGTVSKTVEICTDCHEAIHALFSNKELENQYNSVESLMANERFQKTVKFIAKQDSSRKTKTRLANDQRKRGRNG